MTPVLLEADEAGSGQVPAQVEGPARVEAVVTRQAADERYQRLVVRHLRGMESRISQVTADQLQF